MIEKFLRDIDRDHSSLFAHGIGKESRKKSRSCADVGDGFAGFDLTRFDDGVALRKNFAALYFKFADEILHVGIAKGIIDAGADALVLSN